MKSDAADEHNGPVFKAESLPVAKRARIEEVVANDAFQPTIKKQKKMKFSSILKGMMLGNSKPLVAEEEREALRRGLGGGDFEKVAKI